MTYMHVCVCVRVCVNSQVFSTPKHSEMDSRTWIADMLVSDNYVVIHYTTCIGYYPGKRVTSVMLHKEWMYA